MCTVGIDSNSVTIVVEKLFFNYVSFEQRLTSTFRYDPPGTTLNCDESTLMWSVGALLMTGYAIYMHGTQNHMTMMSGCKQGMHGYKSIITPLPLLWYWSGCIYRAFKIASYSICMLYNGISEYLTNLFCSSLSVWLISLLFSWYTTSGSLFEGHIIKKKFFDYNGNTIVYSYSTQLLLHV